MDLVMPALPATETDLAPVSSELGHRFAFVLDELVLASH